MPEQLQLAIGIDARPAEKGAARLVRSLKDIRKAAADAGARGFRRMEAAGRKLGARLSALSKKSINIDSKLRLVGFAAVAAFAFAIKSSIDFEKSMSRIIGLVNLAAKDVKAFEKPLLDIARATGKGPNELAEALFFITSAGARGAAAIDILEQSARAAAAGLGETKSVADAVTSAVNAYGAANLTAAQSTDVLVATVREGKAEADSIAGALGRVLPIAKQLSVTFDQVGGTVAALTRVGLDANEATTSLRAALSLINKPGQEAIDTLQDAKLTMQDVRDVIIDKGLLEALLFLEKAFKGNTQQLTKIFPNLRANAGIFSLIGDNAEISRKIFKGVKDSVGAMDNAFAAFEETTLADLQKSTVSLQISFKIIADELLPAVAAAFGFLASKVERTVEVFKGLGAAIAQAISGDQDPITRALNRQRELSDAVEDFGFEIRKVTRTLDDGTRVIEEVRVPLTQFDKWLVKVTGINRAGIELTGTYEEQLAQLKEAVMTQDIIVSQLEGEVAQRLETERLARMTADAVGDIADEADELEDKVVIDTERAGAALKVFESLKLEVFELGTGLAGLQAQGLKGLGIAEDAAAADKLFKDLQGTIEGLTKQQLVDLIRTQRALNDEIAATSDIFEELKTSVEDTRTPLESLNIELKRIAELRVFAEITGDVEQLEALTRRSAMAMLTFRDVIEAIDPNPIVRVQVQLDLLRAQLATIGEGDVGFDALTEGIMRTEEALINAQLRALGLSDLKTIMEETIPVSEQLSIAQERLREIFSDPIDQEKLEAALNALEKKFDTTNDLTKEFAVQAARNIQTAFADFLFDPFSEGLDGMVFKFAESLKKIAAEILANQILTAFFKSLTGVGGGIGTFADAALGSISGNQFGGSVQRGVPSLVNEAGSAKGEVFVPGQDGRVMTQQQAQQGAAPSVEVPVSITNVVDPQDTVAVLESAAGSKAIMNVISTNPATIRRLLA